MSPRSRVSPPRWAWSLTLFAMLALSATPARAALPPLMNYQGFLTDASNTPRNGTYSMSFALFPDSTGGAALWSESYPVGSVDVFAGVFNVLLGSRVTLPSTAFSGAVLWLQTTVSDTVLAPRRPIVTVAYAFRSAVADSAAVAGTSAGELWQTNGTNVWRLNGDVGVGTATPVQRLDVRGSGRFVWYNEIDDDGSRGPQMSLVSRLPGGRQYSVSQGEIPGRPSHFDIVDETAGGLPRLTIDESGNVGIGNNLPSKRLDVSGQVHVTDAMGIGPDTPWSASGPGIFLDAGSQTSLIAWDNRINTGFRMYQEGAGNAFHFASSGGGSTETWQFTSAGLGNLFTIGPTLTAYRPLTVNGDLLVTGAKNAIVPTSQGMTKVYSEESAEVWFTDYGHGRLSDGACHIDLTPLFLETVSITPEHPIMVFVQEEGESNGLIVVPGLTGFDIREKTNGRSHVPFSYRIVAKRKGFEKDRLAPVTRPTTAGIESAH